MILKASPLQTMLNFEPPGLGSHRSLCLYVDKSESSLPITAKFTTYDGWM